MAYTETNIRRDASSSTIKMVLSSGDTDTTIFDLKGVKSLYLVCDGNTKAYLPTVSDAGVMTVPVSDLAYAEVTLVDTDSNTSGIQAHSSMRGSASQPLQIVGDYVPSHAYFVLPANATAWLYLTY